MASTPHMLRYLRRDFMGAYPKNRNRLIPGMKEKRCLGPCNRTLDLDEFPVNNLHRDGREKRCRDCMKQKRKERTYLRTPTRMAWEKEYYEQHREEILAANRRSNQALRNEILDAYGRECVCCGEPIVEFLALDHINNDGAEERRRLGGRNLYLELRKAGFPQGCYQMLCHNCNTAKKAYGSCPHEKV